MGGQMIETEVPLITPDPRVEIEDVRVSIDRFVDPVGDEKSPLLVAGDRMPDDPDPALIRNRRDAERATGILAAIGGAATRPVDLIPLTNADGVRVDSCAGAQRD